MEGKKSIKVWLDQGLYDSLWLMAFRKRVPMSKVIRRCLEGVQKLLFIELHLQKELAKENPKIGKYTWHELMKEQFEVMKRDSKSKLDEVMACVLIQLEKDREKKEKVAEAQEADKVQVEPSIESVHEALASESGPATVQETL